MCVRSIKLCEIHGPQNLRDTHTHKINITEVSLRNIKGEVNPNIKLDLNDSFCALINKSNPQIF